MPQGEKTRAQVWRKRQLTPVQEKEIRRILIDKSPDQMKWSFMLWTRAVVCRLVEEKYGITITLRNMSEYLKRWGMTCQRPSRKAYFQDNVKLNAFMHETYPVIVNKARTEDTVIFWGGRWDGNQQPGLPCVWFCTKGSDTCYAILFKSGKNKHDIGDQ